MKSFEMDRPFLMKYLEAVPQKCSCKKDVLQICSKLTGEHPYGKVISIKLLCNLNEITFAHRCSPVNLLHIFRISFHNTTFGRLFLNIRKVSSSRN